MSAKDVVSSFSQQRAIPMRQEDPPALDVCPIGFAGRDKQTLYFIRDGCIVAYRQNDITTNGVSNLFSGDLGWLEANFPKEGNRERQVYDMDDVRDFLNRSCAAAGTFIPGLYERGVGVWRGPHEEIILNNGDCVEVNGVSHAPGLKLGGYVYVACPPQERPALKEAKENEAADLEDVLSSFSFARGKTDIVLIMGFMATSMLGGAPPYRPHLWLTGGKGLGKSLFVDLLSAVMGAGAHPCKTDVTQAGLRQDYNGTARLIVLDEAENHARSEALQEALRHMYSGEGARASRGTAGGSSVHYHMTGNAFLASIMRPDLTPQDASRFLCITLARRARDVDSLGRTREGIERLKALSPAFRRRMLIGWKRYIECIHIYRCALLSHGMTDRTGDTLAAVLAGHWVLTRPRTPDTDSVACILEDIAPHLEECMAAEEDDFGQRCLNALYSYDVLIEKTRYSLGQVIADALPGRDYSSIFGGVDPNKLLGTYGLRIERYQKERCGVVLPPCIVVAQRHGALKRIFQGSEFDGGRWSQALCQLDGVMKAPYNASFRFAGSAARGVVIPKAWWPGEAEGEQ